MKLPAFQFYPGDWRKDVGVQSLDFHCRGVWFEILCLMHESERRGVLTLNGKAMPEGALARLLGISEDLLKQNLTTLLSHGVTSLEPETGAIMSRRMVRDEELRKIRQNAGKQGGNPLLLKQKPTTGLNQKSTPSSSSSVSSSESIAPPNGTAPKSRARDPLIDALASVNGSDPKQIVQSSWPGIGKALSEIRKVCPDLTASEIQRRAVNYHTHMSGATLTPHALAKHWALCEKAATPDLFNGARPAPARLNIIQVPEHASSDSQ